MGIKDDEVLHRHVESEFKCAICLDLVLDAVHTPCAHLFCSQCIKHALQRHKKCPQDNQPLTLSQLVPLKEANPLVHRILGKIHVRCPHYVQSETEDNSPGCSWEGEYSERNSHLETCGWERVECSLPGCTTRVLRRRQDEHENSCEFREAECQWCHRQMTVRNLKKHSEKDCAMCPIVCQNGCRETITRADIRAHLESVCPQANVSCVFPGCDASVLRKDMGQHTLDSLQKHLVLAAEALRQQTTQIDRLSRVVEEQSGQLQMQVAEIAKLRQKNERHYTWKISKWSEKKQHEFLNSDMFHIDNYKFWLKLFPNGHARRKDTHLSLFLYNHVGEYDALLKWPLCLLGFTIHIIDQTRDGPPNHASRSFSAEAHLGPGTGLGWDHFLSLEALERRQCVLDDTLFVKVIVKNTDNSCWLHEFDS